MSWYDANFKYRMPVAIDSTVAAGNYDCEWVIPSKFSSFWDNIQSSGFDIYPVSNTGTLLSFERTGYNYANKTLTLSIDLMPLADTAVTLSWLYWGYASAANASASRTITAPKAGQFWLGRPKNMIVGPISFIGGASNPLAAFVKNSSSEMYVWFEAKSLLSTRFSPYEDHNSYEGIDSVKVLIYDNAGSVQASMADQSKTRFAPGGYIGVIIKAGTSGNNYQVNVQVNTTENQIIYLTATVQVRDQLPS